MVAKTVKKNGKSEPDDQGLWVDTALIARLHGRKSPLSIPTLTAEAQRLLHYADVVLGTEKKERFRAAKVEKRRRT
jgi:hypothetical protein